MSVATAINSARVPSGIWTRKDDMDRVMEILEAELGVSRATDPDRWLLVKASLYYFASTRRDADTSAVLEFARRTLESREKLIAMGYTEVEVDHWLEFNEPDIASALEYLSKTNEEKLQEYYAHEGSVEG